MGAQLREVFLPISSLPSFSVGAILFWKEFALRGALLSPRTTKLWRGYRVCPVRMYVSTYVRTYVRSYVHLL